MHDRYRLPFGVFLCRRRALHADARRGRVRHAVSRCEPSARRVRVGRRRGAASPAPCRAAWVWWMDHRGSFLCATACGCLRGTGIRVKALLCFRMSVALHVVAFRNASSFSWPGGAEACMALSGFAAERLCGSCAWCACSFAFVHVSACMCTSFSFCICGGLHGRDVSWMLLYRSVHMPMYRAAEGGGARAWFC